jgi:hypothetical protein
MAIWTANGHQDDQQYHQHGQTPDGQQRELDNTPDDVQ